EDRLPKLVTSLGDSALAMDTKRQPPNRGTGAQECLDGVPAVGCVGVGRQTLDDVIGLWTIDPLVSVGPKAQLKVQAPLHSFLADESQHLEIPIPLRIGQGHGTDLVARCREQEGIGEVEICVADIGREVVTQPEGETETVESMGSELGEVPLPEWQMIEPRFV